MTVAYISSSNLADASSRRDRSRVNRSATRPGRGESGASTVPAAAPSAGHAKPQAQLLAVAGKSDAGERRAVREAAAQACPRSTPGGC